MATTTMRLGLILILSLAIIQISKAKSETEDQNELDQESEASMMVSSSEEAKIRNVREAGKNGNKLDRKEENAQKKKKKKKGGKARRKAGRRKIKVGRRQRKKGGKAGKGGKKPRNGAGRKRPRKGKKRNNNKRKSEKEFKKKKKKRRQNKNGKRQKRITKKKGKSKKVQTGIVRQGTCDEAKLCQKIKDYIKYSNQLRKVRRIVKSCDTMDKKATKAATEFSATVAALDQVISGNAKRQLYIRWRRTKRSTDEVVAIRDNLKNCSASAKAKCEKSVEPACAESAIHTECDAALEAWLKSFGPSKGSCLQASADCCACITALPEVDAKCLDFEAKSKAAVDSKKKCTGGTETGSFGFCRKQQQDASVKGPKAACGGSTATQAPGASTTKAATGASTAAQGGSGTTAAPSVTTAAPSGPTTAFSGNPSSFLVKRSLGSYPLAVCNDGTTAVYYAQENTPATKKMVIYLRGGGACFSVDHCKTRCGGGEDAELCTAPTDEDYSNSDTMWSNDPTVNPPFHDFFKVNVPYCSSDAYSGTRSASADTGNFAFHGKFIVRAIIEDLIASHSWLTEATQIVLIGSSAGSYGVEKNCDEISERFRQINANVDVRCIMDGGGFYPYTHYTSCVPLEASKTPVSFWQGENDKSCGNAVECNIFAASYEHVSTPFMVLQSQEDRIAAQPFCTPETDAPGSEDFWSKWKTEMVALANKMIQSRPESGLHISGCPYHVGVAQPWIWSDLKVAVLDGQGSMALKDLIYNWLTGAKPSQAMDPAGQGQGCQK